MVYTFARVGTALAMRVADFYVQGRRGCPRTTIWTAILEEYIAAADIGKDRKGPLFRSARGRTGEMTESPLLQSDVWRMIRRRAAQVGIQTEIGCHTFRATGITAYFKNGGRLEYLKAKAPPK